MTVQVVSDTHTTHEHTETHTPPRDVRFVCACAHIYSYMIYDPRYNKPPLQLRDRASSLRAVRASHCVTLRPDGRTPDLDGRNLSQGPGTTRRAGPPLQKNK